MRKLTGALFISLDGVVEAPHLWQFDYFNEEMLAGMGEQLASEDAMLMGRVTYEEWSPFWPTSNDEPYASHINKVPKYILSTTLDKVEWGQFDNVTLLKGDVVDEMNKLKAQPGKNIGIGGSPSVIRSMLKANLLDELLLMIHPVVVGEGKRLFPDGSELTKMRLVKSNITSTGIINATYQPRKD